MAEVIEDGFMREPVAAQFLGLSARTLQRFRQEGTGPQFIRMGVRRLVYSRADLVAWMEGHRQRRAA